MNYEPVIGLEIHAELKTRTKMFCDSLNDPEEKHPNQNVCPVCLGHPGTLPTINKAAVEAVLRVGLALGGRISAVAKFDRKNYFYPDLPKGYQISQYDQPLIIGGELNGVKIRRIHLEEDTGRLVHDSPLAGASTELGRKSSGHPASLVDFNRAGVPLMELVTEPDIKSAEEAIGFAKELQLIFRYLGISEADMERGQMRVEVNISLHEIAEQRGFNADLRGIILRESALLGTKVEIKNLNSFRAVEGAVNYEIKRQAEILEKGELIKQETRGWNEAKQQTVSQRLKEEAHDYRYLPEPDLPSFTADAFNIEALEVSLPELPRIKRQRFQGEYRLNEQQAEILISEPALADYFEAAASELTIHDSQLTTYELLYNYLTSDLRGLMNQAEIGFEQLKITPEQFAHLVALAASGKITSRLAKDLLKKMFETGEDPETLIKSEGFELVSGESELEAVVEKIIQENPKAITDFQKGKNESLQFLIGQAMRELKGRGDPRVLKNIFEKLLIK